MNSKLSDRKLLLMQEIQKLNKETSLARVEKLVKEVRLEDDIENLRKAFAVRKEYQWSKNVQKIGTPISGIVISHENVKYSKESNSLYGTLLIETDIGRKGNLAISDLFNLGDKQDENRIPKIGEKINVIIKNASEERLYLKASPNDLSEENINAYQKFYEFIEQYEEGTILKGTVKEHRGFGVFVEFDSSFLGLIRVTEPYQFDSAKQLPRNQEDWPKIGSSIQVVILYYDFNRRQIILYWIPE